MRTKTADAETKKPTDNINEVRGLDELRKLMGEIPEGTIYSIDLSEVIEIEKDNGQSK